MLRPSNDRSVQAERGSGGAEARECLESIDVLVLAGGYVLSAPLLDRIAAMAGPYRFIDIGTPESFARAGDLLGCLRG